MTEASAARSVASSQLPEHRSRRSLLAIGLFLLACLIGVIVWAPAAWLRPALPASLACTETAGTVWRGECRRLQRLDSFGSRAELGQLRWSLSPRSLLSLQPSIDLAWQLEEASARANIQWQPRATWQIRDLYFSSNYRSLSPLVDRDLRRLWQTIPSTESVALSIPNASGSIQEIHDLQAELRFSAFGEHVLTVRPDGSGDIRSGAGALRLSGPLEWQRDGRYRMQLRVGIGSDTDLALRAALAALGPTNARGEYDLTIEGSIWTLLR